MNCTESERERGRRRMNPNPPIYIRVYLSVFTRLPVGPIESAHLQFSFLDNAGSGRAMLFCPGLLYGGEIRPVTKGIKRHQLSKAKQMVPLSL